MSGTQARNARLQRLPYLPDRFLARIGRLLTSNVRAWIPASTLRLSSGEPGKTDEMSA